MRYKSKKNNGFVFIELIVSLGLLGLIITILSGQLILFSRFNDYQLVRQHCTSAAQAELESISITGQPIDSEQFDKLWPGVDISIKKTDGKGQWNGLKLIKVNAEADSYNRKVKVQLNRYISKEKVR